MEPTYDESMEVIMKEMSKDLSAFKSKYDVLRERGGKMGGVLQTIDHFLEEANSGGYHNAF